MADDFKAILDSADTASLKAGLDDTDACAHGWIELVHEHGHEKILDGQANYMQCRMTKAATDFLLKLVRNSTGVTQLSPCNDYGVMVEMLYIDLSVDAVDGYGLPEDTEMSFNNGDLYNNDNLDVDYIDSGEGRIVVSPDRVMLVGNDYDGPAYFLVTREELEYMAS